MISFSFRMVFNWPFCLTRARFCVEFAYGSVLYYPSLLRKPVTTNQMLR